MEKARRCLIDKEKYEFIEKYINLYFSIVDVQLFYNPKPSEIIKDIFKFIKEETNTNITHREVKYCFLSEFIYKYRMPFIKNKNL